MNHTVDPQDADMSGEVEEAVGAERHPMPVSQPVFLRALRWSIASTVLMVIVFGVAGYFISGERGLVGGVIGAAAAGIFFGLTIGSIAFANRFVEHESYLVLFFGIVMGAWLLKFVVFIVGALLLKTQPWLDPRILFSAVIVGVIISLVLDAMIVIKARIPIISMSS